MRVAATRILHDQRLTRHLIALDNLSCRTGAARHNRIAHLRYSPAGNSAESIGRGDLARRLARVDVDPVDRADLPVRKAERGLR